MSFFPKTDYSDRTVKLTMINHVLKCEVSSVTGETLFIEDDIKDCIVPSPRCCEKAINQLKILIRALKSPNPPYIGQVEDFFKSFKISMIISAGQFKPPRNKLLRADAHMRDKVKRVERDRSLYGTATLGAGLWSFVIPPLLIATATTGVSFIRLDEEIKRTYGKIQCQSVSIISEESDRATKYTTLGRPSFLLEVEPKSKKSRFDPRVRVSQYQWGLMMIASAGGVPGTALHAEIIAEGLDDKGNYLIKNYEFFGPKKIRRFEFTHYIPEWTERTKLFKVPVEKIHELDNNFYEDEEKINNGHKLGRFARLADDNKGEINCCLWAFKHIERLGFTAPKPYSYSVRNYTEYSQFLNPILLKPMFEFDVTDETRKKWVRV